MTSRSIAQLGVSREAVDEVSRPKVLVVDDDDRIVGALSSILSHDGYDVVSAPDGTRALATIKSEGPDLSIIDVLLPDIDGIEVCQRIKARQKFGFHMIILMTGFSARARRLDGLNAGADDFLSKPIDPVELVARVRSLLRTKRLYDEVEAHRLELEQRIEERTRELRAANTRLAELNQVKSNLLAVVSHELRTPLLKVKSGLWLTMNGDLEVGERTRAHEMAEAALDLLEYRISDFGILSDPSDLTRAQVSVGDLITAALDHVRILQSGVVKDVIVDLPTRLPPVLVDPNSLTRALAHIIDNAVKFGNSGPVSVRAARRENSVDIEVRDKGIGISKDLIGQVFAPLKQGDDSATRRHGGFGMGLALVKMILDAHGAGIAIESREGTGTTVIISLPLH